MNLLCPNHAADRIALGLACLLLFGCSSRRNAWYSAGVVSPLQPTAVLRPVSGGETAEWHYARAWELENAGQAECVDHYLQAAALSWPTLGDRLHTTGAGSQWELYHSAVTQLLSTAQRYDRWNPESGIVVQGPTGMSPVVAVYHGFPWESSDFQELVAVGDYEVPHLNRKVRTPGIGVPLVAVRHANHSPPFLRKKPSFAATAVVRPVSYSTESSVSADQTSCFGIEFFNPLTAKSLETPVGNLPLARDLSAPFAYPPRGKDRDGLRDFLLPGSSTKGGGLFMIEPYQPGKIPVVFVHGLLSDPVTWVNMVNELRAQQDIIERYQIWGYRYSTGEQFFKSAAILRRQLEEVRNAYDPHRHDSAQSQMVLVGHSMGGLLSKLQVVYSGECLWKSVANRPLGEIVTTPTVRADLMEQFFFDPNSDIARVVFIGTPHQGSADANRIVAQIGASLAELTSEAEQAHDQLIRDNPGVFSREVERRIPRSIDLLKPSSPMLQATLDLPFRPQVKVHSICGVINRPLPLQPTDGVVPLISARIIGVNSERLVAAKHTQLTKKEESIQEVTRILRQHAQQ